MLLTKHSPRSFLTLSDVGTVLSGIHHEKRDVSITEIIVMFVFMARVVLCVSIVTAESVVCILERSNRIVRLTNEVVNDLDVA